MEQARQEMLRRNELVSAVVEILREKYEVPLIYGSHSEAAKEIVNKILILQQGKVWENNDD